MNVLTTDEVAKAERGGRGDEVGGCGANSGEREARRLWDGCAHHHSDRHTRTQLQLERQREEKGYIIYGATWSVAKPKRILCGLWSNRRGGYVVCGQTRIFCAFKEKN